MRLSVPTRNRAVWTALIFGTALSNVAGAIFIYLLMRFALSPAINELVTSTVGFFIGAVVVSVLVLITGTLWLIEPVASWQRKFPAQHSAGHPEQVRRRIVSLPMRQTLLTAAVWALSSIVVVIVATRQDPSLGVVTLLCVLLGGVASSALTYFEAERILRPITIQVLDGSVLAHVYTPTVRTRILTAWVLGTALPIIGILLVAADVGIADNVGQPADIRPAVIALGIAALVFGALANWLTSGAIGDPVDALHGAVRRVRAGDLGAQVTVYDTSELGQLQVGFNAMTRGLAEQQQLQDLFGRYVGEDVARQALEYGTDLGGEEREVAVLFVDLVGSTTITDTSRPQDVVRLLNKFFEAVITVVDKHGGFVNKFQGDATLAVFGVPIKRGNSCTAALAAARELHPLLVDIVGPAGAGIGVSAGLAIAGHVGSADRFEYTVIGTPVNEAARLTELAKDEPGVTLASEAALAQADPDEQAHWVLGESITLRGRTAPTRLARPRQ